MKQYLTYSLAVLSLLTALSVTGCRGYNRQVTSCTKYNRAKK